MNFSSPWILLLLAVPILLIVWHWKRTGNRLVLPFDYGVQQEGRGWAFLINSAAMLPPLLLAVVIVILAGPLQTVAPKFKRSVTNIEFCVDVSGSMTASFGEGTRYDASMKAINEFLDFRKGDAFGLTFFGNNVLHWVPLTTDVSAIKCSPPFMNPNSPNHPHWLGGTEIGKALRACQKVLKSREEADRMIVLISDGYSYDLGNGDGAGTELAASLKSDGIVVYAIHIAASEAPDALANITGLTGGEVFEPEDPGAMTTLFQKIDVMQKTKMERKAAESMDYFFPYSLAGLIMLGIALLSLSGLRYTPW